MTELQLENYIPIFMAQVKKVQQEFESKETERDKLVDEINQKYIDAGLGHIIHLRDDGTINYEGCCRSCYWHP